VDAQCTARARATEPRRNAHGLEHQRDLGWSLAAYASRTQRTSSHRERVEMMDANFAVHTQGDVELGAIKVLTQTETTKHIDVSLLTCLLLRFVSDRVCAGYVRPHARRQ
jgi:hypothetical protein